MSNSWLTKARYGLFIHHGLYSLLRHGERVWNSGATERTHNTRQITQILGMSVALLALSSGLHAVEPNQTKIKTMNSKTEPLIRIREVISSTPWGGWVKESMPLDLRQRMFLPFWSEARLRRHIEMLKAFGFNSIQVTVPTVALWCGADLESWRKRQLFMLRTARELGMSTSQFVWGAAVADPARKGAGMLEAQQVSELDWHKPIDRARLEAWYRDQAECGPVVDRVVTHWVDPGHEQEGGIDTVIEMHNFIMAVYREKNPGIHGYLSAWFMDNFVGKRYPGYTDEGVLAANKRLDRDSGVALGRLNYSCDGLNTVGGNSGMTLADRESRVSGEILDAIAAAGRQAGVWGWYTSDVEINPALHVRTDVMQNYFRNLPSQARTQLAWHSIDDNFPGLNMQNLYVAGKLMQDPSLDAQALLEEFCRGFVGEGNTLAVTAALRAIEQARTRSLLYNARVEDALAPVSGAKAPPLPASWLDDASKAVDAAIAGMKTVQMAPDFKTAWPVTMEPAEYLPELNAHLEAIRQMLAFLKGEREVEVLQDNGAPKEQIEAAIAALPAVIYDPAHTAGLEAGIYKQKLAALKTATGTK